MSIRRKLLLSFTAVTLVPIVVLLVVATWYWRSQRAALDQAFVKQAAQECAKQKDPYDDLIELANDRNLLLSSKRWGKLAHAADSDFIGGDYDLLMSVAPQLRDALPEELFAASPAVIAVGVWSNHLHRFDLWKDRAGAATPPGSIDSWLRDDGKPRSNAYTDASDGRHFVISTSGSQSTLVLEVDLRKTGSVHSFGANGFVFPALAGKPWIDAPDPRLVELAAAGVAHGETRDVRDESGRMMRVYAALSAETPVALVSEGVELYAAMPVGEIYGPIGTLPFKVGAAVVTSLLLAFALADRLSRRFVGDIERIRSTVDAIGRGELAHLEATSSDELGGALVRSVNEMAAALAARGVREETAAWRRLVQVLSHEINNTLAPVRSVASTMRRGLAKRLRDDDAGADLDQSLNLIVDRVDALAKFIAGSAEVAKVPEPQRQLADFDRIVTGAAGMFAELAAGKSLALHVDSAVGAVSIDVRLVERVIVNLVKNAIEAAPTGGHVRVSATLHAADVELLVEDDGPGIADDARGSLFVPYFTTKPGGSGIGLALVRQIVVAHGGTVTAEDRTAGGTVMRVRLPAVTSHPYRASA